MSHYTNTKLKTALFALTIFATCQLYGQTIPYANKSVENQHIPTADSLRKSVVYHGGDIGVGGTYGIHPNYRNDYAGAFQFVEGLQRVSVKDRAFSASFRLSNEKFLSGQPSYFRLSYDGSSGYRNGLSKKQMRLDQLTRLLGFANDSLAKLEGKLSYLRLKRYEWEQRKIRSSR